VSQDLVDWNPLGEPFTADEPISHVADMDPSSNICFYKIQVLPEE